MAILKNYTNPRGLMLGYHKVYEIIIRSDSCIAMIDNWATKEAYELDPYMSVFRQEIAVPIGILGTEPIDNVQNWLISPGNLFAGGQLDVGIDALAQAKQVRKQFIRDEQDKFEFGGVDVPGIGRVATDANSQRLLIGTAVLAMIAASQEQPFNVDWTLADGSSVSLDIARVTSASVVVGQHVAAVFAAGRVAQAAIDSAETVEEVNSIVFIEPP